MYGNDRRGNINGVFFQRLGANGEIETANQKEFSARDLEILGNRNSDKEGNGKGSIEDVFIFGDQLTQTDGSIVISAEHNYEQSNNRDINGNFTTTFFSRDIIVIHFESSGEIRGINLIPKLQSSSSRSFIYHASVALDNLPAFFIYNDNRDNIDRPIDKRPKSTSGSTNGVTSLNYIDDKGELQKKVLIDNRKMRSLVLTKTCKRIDGNSFFFIAQRPKFFGRDSFYMGSVSF